MARKRLYIFTDEYPFGRGEKSFIEPELQRFTGVYDVTVVSHAPTEDAKRSDGHNVMPAGVSLLRWHRPSKQKRAFRILGALTAKLVRSELRFAMRDGFSLQRFLDVCNEYIVAEDMRAFYRRCGIFSDGNEAIYYSFWFGEKTLALALEQHESSSLCIISRIHGYDLYNERRKSGFQPFQRFKLALCRRIYFASKFGMDYFRDTFGEQVFAGQYELSRLGVARRSANPASTSPGIVVVSCSNLIPLKRVHLIAEAVNKLQSTGYPVKWIHFGDGPERPRIEEYCRENEINAHLCGHVPNDDIGVFYESEHVDVFVHVSSTEGGCPVAIQEAMSAGIPIVASGVGGVTEMINGNGVLVGASPQANDVAAAIECILLSSPAQIAVLRTRSREMWSEMFDVEKNKSAFMSSINDVVRL